MQPQPAPPQQQQPSGKSGKRMRQGGDGGGGGKGGATLGEGGVAEVNGNMQAKRRALGEERKQLPIHAAKDRLLQELREHETVIVVGETGSGKTTQIPQFVHAAGLGSGLMVACTQPRRVAAISVARRVAEETGTALGDLVGYAIRFEEVSSPATRIKFLTDGMLLREAMTDPMLSRYGVVMIDEAHERTLQTDFLLGTVKGVQDRRREMQMQAHGELGAVGGSGAKPKRRGAVQARLGGASSSLGPLRLVVMSATLEASSFSAFFSGAPVVYSRVRKYPIEMFYTEEPEDDYLDAALCAVCQINEDEPAGDILVFLTGQEEIESLGRLLRARSGHQPEGIPALNVVLLFAAMPSEEQMRVFEVTPLGTRKVVLATNIAETSLTINGIRYVVDSGLTKRRIYHPRSGVDELLVAPVAVSQATQRAGRAGREGPGKCFRLYCEDAVQSLEPHVTPELLRTNLGGVVLQLKAMGVVDITGFPFIDAPPRESLVRALELLFALGALDKDGALNAVGRKMSRFPLEPMAAKAIISAADEGCTEDTISVLSMLTTDSVFQQQSKASMAGTPAGSRDKKHLGREQYARKEGDHVTLLAVFCAFQACAAKRRREWCATNSINLRAMAKAADIFKQLSRLAVGEGIEMKSRGAETSPLLRSMVAGYFLNTARKQVDGSFKTVSTGQKLVIHPSSVLFQQPPEMIFFNELVKTNRLYARDVSAILPEWLAEMSPNVYSVKNTTPSLRAT